MVQPTEQHESRTASSGRWDRPAQGGSTSPARRVGDPQPEGQRPAGPPVGIKKIKQDEIIYFSTQLAVMVDTGVPLADALDAIAKETAHLGLQMMVQEIAEDVKAGVDFSAALEKHPKHFPRLYIALIKASEASGRMGQMLQRVSEYMVEERDIRKQVKGAMAYPIAMLGFCLLVVVGLLVFVLPQFRDIYEGKGAVLPAPTQFLLSLSDGVIEYWPLLVGGLVLATAGAWYYVRTEQGKRTVDRIRISLPVIGPMYRKAYLSRSLRTMSTMVATGVGILDGLAITAEVAGNYYYASIWTHLARRAEEGLTLSEGLREYSDLVPHGISQMVSAGERTGHLDTVMERVASFCEDDLKQSIKTMTNFIEPVMIVVIGSIIGGIAIALLLPIFNASQIMST